MAPRELPLPAAARRHLVDLIRLRWTGPGGDAAASALPAALPEGAVVKLLGGGPFGWVAFGRLDELEGRLALEVLEDSRMSGPERYRVWDDGATEPLLTERTGYVLPKDWTADDEARIKAEWAAHNRAARAELVERGFADG